MKKLTSLLVLSVAAFAGGVSAADVDLSKLPPAAKQEGVTYEKDIKPIFKESCFGCHGEQRPRGGLRVDSLEAVMKGASQRGETIPVIVAGQGEKSALLIAVARLDPKTAMPKAPPRRPGGGAPGTNAPAGGDMARPGGPAGQPGEPPAGGPGGPGGRGPQGPPPKNLTPEQVSLVRAWIDQGAK